MRLLLLISIAIFFQFACNSGEVTQETTCDVDVVFLNNYLKDFSSIMDYCLQDEKDIDRAFKAFINLEILANNRNDLDSLGFVFYDSNSLRDNLSILMTLTK